MQKKILPVKEDDRPVLVVDDDECNRDLLAMILSSSGNRVLKASNGEEAVEMYRLHSPKTVIMDVNMPFMNGIDAAREILEHDKKARIIFNSATADPDEIRKMKALSNLRLEKPFSMIDLDEMLKRIDELRRNGEKDGRKKDQCFNFKTSSAFDFLA